MVTIGIIIGVIGIILTIIFGVHQIIQSNKTKRKISLGLERKECYSLFKNDINRLNIKVEYSDKPIDNYLILFKGKLINIGQEDIDKNKIYKPLHLKTKNNFAWLEANISNKRPEGISATFSKIDNLTLELNWDLLKVGEFIEFESLIEIPQDTEIEEIGDYFYESLEFDYRITDLKEIQKLTDINLKDKRRKKTRRRSIALSIFLIVASIFIFFPDKLPKEISLMPIPTIMKFKVLNKADTIDTQIIPNGVKQIKLKNENRTKEIEFKKFKEDYKVLGVESLVIDKQMITFYRIIGGIYLIGAIGLLIILFYEKKKVSLKKPNYRRATIK